MNRRIWSLFLAVILLLSTCLMSCKKQDGELSQSTEETEEQDALAYLDTLPDNDTGYTELRAMAIESNCISDDLAGSTSAVDQALITRDNIVEERYGIDIVYSPVTARFVMDTMRQSVLSGDNSFNVFLYQAQELMTLATEGLLQDLNEVPNLNFDGEWWSQSLCKNLLINDKLYTAAGQWSQWYFGAPVALAYNKDLASDYGIEGIDELVDSGNWTLETMKELCKNHNITVDKDNNGIMNEKDTYMISAYSPVLYGLYASAGGRFSTLNKDTGAIQVNIASDANIQRLDAAIGVFNSQTTYYSDLIAEVETVFKDERSLFFYAPLGFTADLLDVEFDYGILPTPKLNESQNKYIACANPQSNFCLSIPTGLGEEETEFVGLILEAYNFTSSVYLKPAKYDSFMKHRVAADPASSTRLDDMFNSLYFDMNLVMDFGSSRTLINSTIFNESTSRYVSAVAASKSMIDADIKDLVGVSSKS